MSVWPSAKCTFTPAGATISTPSPCRRAAASPRPGCCPPARRRAVHPPVRSRSSPFGGRTRSRNVASAGTSFAAPSASATVASWDAFRAVRPNWTRQRNSRLVAMPWRRQTAATATPGFSLSCTIARFCSSLKRRRFDLPSTSCAVRRYLRHVQLAAQLNCAPGTWMKQVSPVQFVAGFFEPIAPDAQRMRRQTKRCAVLRKPHAAPVHRLYMHAPERLKRNRTGVRAHAVTIARRSCPRLQLPLLVLLFWRFPRQISQMFCTVTQLFLAQQTTRPPHQACRGEIVPLAVVLGFKCAAIPGRNVVRPERVVGLCPGTKRCHRRSSTAVENPKWNENTSSKRSAGLGRLRTPN